MKEIRIRVFGDPRPQPRQRHRAFKSGGRIITANYTPKDASVNSWKDMIALTAREHLRQDPIEGPIRVDSYYYFRRPKSHFRTGKFSHVLKDSAPFYHMKKPDRDNLDKSFLDIMTQIGFWRDDCQVVSGELQKTYTYEQRPGALFIISFLEDNHGNN